MKCTNPKAIAPNDLFALRYVRDARLSPDGRCVAYAISRTDESKNAEYCELWLEDLQSKERKQVAAGDVFAGSPRWSRCGSFLAYVATDVSGNRVWIYSVRSDSAKPVQSAGSRIQGAATWSPDGSKIALCTFIEEPSQENYRFRERIFKGEGRGSLAGRAGLLICDVESDTCVAYDAGDDIWSSPEWGPQGSQILVLAKAKRTLGDCRFPHLSSVDAKTGRAREILSDRWALEVATWCPDGSRIVFAGSHASPERLPAAGLWVVNEDGSSAQCRSDDSIPHVGFRFHHDMPVWDGHPTLAIPNNHFSFVTVQAGGYSSIFKVALDGPVACRKIVGGERSCVLLDASQSERRLLYWTTSFVTPCELVTSHWDDSDSECQLTDLNSGVMSRWPRVRIESLRIESSDSLQLEGWYLSRQDASGPQPTVTFVHGGPYIGTGCVFRFDFLMLATNGYSVLFANYRGSLGYGREFSLAIDLNWGESGFLDHMATVDAAVSRGLADRERIGIWGPSHGGFATAWAVGHTTRFRAAVAEASITDFTSAYYLSDLPDLISDLLGGAPHEATEAYRVNSPLTYASECRTPTLLLHGDSDVRCPIAGAEAFYRTLHDAGCVTEFVRLKDCDHLGDSMGPLSARLGQNEALLNWFTRYL